MIFRYTTSSIPIEVRRFCPPETPFRKTLPTCASVDHISVAEKGNRGQRGEGPKSERNERRHDAQRRIAVCSVQVPWTMRWARVMLNARPFSIIIGEVAVTAAVAALRQAFAPSSGPQKVQGKTRKYATTFPGFHACMVEICPNAT